MQTDPKPQAQPIQGRDEASTQADLTIRLSRAADEPELRRLSELDSRAQPGGRAYLLAERGGALVAAVPLAGGEVMADPFKRTADVARLLELRARQLRGDTPAAPRRRRLIGRVPLLGH